MNKILHLDDFKKLFVYSKEKNLEFRIYSKDEKIKWLQGKKQINMLIKTN